MKLKLHTSFGNYEVQPEEIRLAKYGNITFFSPLPKVGSSSGRISFKYAFDVSCISVLC